MKLGIILLVIGLAGVLLMFLPAVEIGNADIYANPWVLFIGLICFIIFFYGLFRVLAALRRKSEERYRRK